MIIGTNQNVHKTEDLIAVHVDSALIKRVNKWRYLGLIVDDRLSWKDHIPGGTSILGGRGGGLGPKICL